MSYYQCFKTKDRDVYCSSYEVKSHAEGAIWVRDCMEHYSIKGNDLLGKPFEVDDYDQDDAAITSWP